MNENDLLNNTILTDTSKKGPEELNKPRLCFCVMFNGKRIELEVDDPKTLHIEDVLTFLVRKLSLSESVVLEVCTSLNERYFDKNLNLSDVLKQLSDTEDLIVCLGNLPSISTIGFDTENKNSSIPKIVKKTVKTFFTKDIAVATSKSERVVQVGQGRIRFSGNDIHPIYGYEPRGSLLIPLNLLDTLREKIEIDPILPWIDRLVGIFLGICISLVIPLIDGELERPLWAGIIGAFLISVLVMIMLFFFEHKVKAKQRERLKWVMSVLSTEKKQDG